MSVPQLQYKLFFAESGGIKAPLCPEKTPGSTLLCMLRVKAAHGAPDGRSRLADAIFITTIVRGGRGDGGEFDSHLSTDCPLAKKWRFCTCAFFPNCLFFIPMSFSPSPY